jgi:hypothetical protein
MNEQIKLALPQLGSIRKGAGKVTRQNAQGASYQSVGPDLKDRFRLDFFSGFEDSVRKAVEVFGSLTPTRIIATLPFNSMNDCWVDAYEAYTKGRMIARADDEHFIRLVDLATGKVVVNNGEPYTPHTPGQVLGIVGKTPVKTRRTGRLTLVLPALERMATMTLHTTSIYDCVNIGGQLAAIQIIANAARLPLAGIPLLITRRLAEVTWVKESGESCRVTTGLIQVEADPSWVKYMLRDMARRALPQADKPLELNSGEPTVNIPQADAQQAGEDAATGGIDPEDIGGPDDDNTVDGESTDVTDTTPAPAAQAPAATPSAAMSLQSACEVVTEDEPKTKYGDLPSDRLSFMANSLTKSLRENHLAPEVKVDKQYRLDAALTIMRSRNKK